MNPRLRVTWRAASAWLVASAALVGCATAPEPPAAPQETPPPAAWHGVALPGKKSTRYHWVHKDGRVALMAQAERSASLSRCRIRVEPQDLAGLSFSWRVDELPVNASVAELEREDAAARVVLGFGGERSKLSLRNRMLFELAEAVSGESPPYATLMYVWDTTAPVGTVIVNPRTDRVRKIVVDSGRGHLGQWREHRRDVAADFRRAFGEEPGPLVSLAVMTDADNTQSRATAWYGPIDLR